MQSEYYGSYHRGRIKQVPIYLGKFMRMFIYLNDWRVLPMSVLIAGIVAFVACGNMFVTMEGTEMGAMALTCVCLWNGCFNSIQVVCRERGIVKREHRSGMHISSYIAAHMIYQAALCLMQVVITIAVCCAASLHFPPHGFMTPWFLLDLGITLFLITYASDMLSLMISCIVKNTTAAMTAMPLVLIFQLVFSGIMFPLGPEFEPVGRLTIAKWGQDCICAQAAYNTQPMVAVWNMLVKFCRYDFFGETPLLSFAQYIEQNNLVDSFCMEIGQASTIEAYEMTMNNILGCWVHLLVFIGVFAVAAVLFLEFIDRDKR